MTLKSAWFFNHKSSVAAQNRRCLLSDAAGSQRVSKHEPIGPLGRRIEDARVAREMAKHEADAAAMLSDDERMRLVAAANDALWGGRYRD